MMCGELTTTANDYELVLSQKLSLGLKVYQEVKQGKGVAGRTLDMVS
jgi:hypothetical protein